MKLHLFMNCSCALQHEHYNTLQQPLQKMQCYENISLIPSISWNICNLSYSNLFVHFYQERFSWMHLMESVCFIVTCLCYYIQWNKDCDEDYFLLIWHWDMHLGKRYISLSDLKTIMYTSQKAWTNLFPYVQTIQVYSFSSTKLIFNFFVWKVTTFNNSLRYS